MAEAQKHSILIVDDDHMMRELLKAILRGEGYRIVGEASNGLDAVELCVNQRPDLVLLDINMPKMDGLTALEEIRKANPSAMVLMVSGEATMNKVNEAMQKGASGFVVKPLVPANVLERVRMCCKRKNSYVKGTDAGVVSGG